MAYSGTAHGTSEMKEPFRKETSGSFSPLVLLGIFVSLFSVLRIFSKRRVDQTRTQSQSAAVENNFVIRTAATHVSVPPTLPGNGTPKWKKFAEISVAVGTLGLLGVNVLLWLANKKSSDAAENSANVAAKQFEFVERPKVSGYIKFIRPATLTPQDGMTIDVLLTLNNTGQTPAVKTFIQSEMFPITWTSNIPVVSRTRDRACKTAIQLSKTSDPFYPTIYPGREVQWNIGQRIQPKEINELVKKSEAIVAAFIICVAYHPNFTTADYFTSFVYTVARRDQARPKDRLVFLPQYGTIPIENLDAGEPEISPE
jgi:hypothetical protein